MRLQRKKYLLDLEQDKKLKAQQAAQKRREALIFKQKAKEACKVIEKCRYRILHLRELKQLR